MLPIALEEKLGEILYLQSLIRQAYVFRKGIQHLIRGQLTMDLVPREYMSSAVSEVNKYLQLSYSRFHVAFTSPSFYYENSRPLFKYNETSNKLTVFVRIPVVADEHLFRIYEVLTFPVPLLGTGKDAKGCSTNCEFTHECSHVHVQAVLCASNKQQLVRMLRPVHNALQGLTLYEENNRQYLHSSPTKAG